MPTLATPFVNGAMNGSMDSQEAALLPAGMNDGLPPDAAFEAHVIETLMARFSAFGFERVKPPLMEFEDTLLRGPGAATAGDAFRLMDPVSQRMMAVRADMTPQIARIAASRLANAPRPLRLSYAGQIVRVRGSQLRGARQFGQVGAEIIGSSSRLADAELIAMAAGSLNALGIKNLSVDLCTPTLVPAVCDDRGIPDEAAAPLRAALDRKDAAAVEALRAGLGDASTDLFAQLLAATGESGTMLQRLNAIDLGPRSAAEREELASVIALLHERAPDLRLTIDPVERRGWEYHTGLSFTLYASGARGELGAGGRYFTGDADVNAATREAATGVTLFTDSLMQALPAPRRESRIFVPAGVDPARAAELREQGLITVLGLSTDSDPHKEAQRLGCGQILTNEGLRPVTKE